MKLGWIFYLAYAAGNFTAALLLAVVTFLLGSEKPDYWAPVANATLLVFVFLFPAYQVWLNAGLIDAAWEGNAGKIERVLSMGANANVKLKNGRTALMWAAGEGHTDVVKLLLAKGADVNAKDKDGETALKKATANNHSDVVELLKAHGATE